jgi:toxin-antitoxin system PIN domain toxin
MVARSPQSAAGAGTSLLDVNVLVALFFPDHVHHELAHDWFADHHEDGWATCPTTENGFVRVACQQPSGDTVLRPVDVIGSFRRFCESPHHHRWADAVSMSDPDLFSVEYVRGHRQITDVYLLGLAIRMGGRLVTFDRTIPVKAVRGAGPDSLQIIEPPSLRRSEGIEQKIRSSEGR